jgi:excisionase family DNA binding protein
MAGRRKLPKPRSRPKIQDLETHPASFVTTAELAEYWLVSRKQIYKQIQARTLKAIRLGPRLLRISTADAVRFERLAKMTHSDTSGVASERKVSSARRRTR